MEDRTMKMTLIEGLGLLAAVVVGTTLTLATYAGPPKSVPGDVARVTLERLAERVVALPDGPDEDGSKGDALLEIARAQVKLGDRAAALATLRRFDELTEPSPPKPGAKAYPRAWARLTVLSQSAAIWRDAGDLAGARAALRRAAHDFEVLDAGAFRGAIERMGTEVDKAIAAGKANTIEEDEESEMIGDASFDLIDRCIALGDMALARTLVRRLVEAVGPPQGPLQAMMIADLGGYLVKAGDRVGGRAVIERSLQAALALPDPEARAYALPRLAGAMLEAGELDKVLALLREMTPRIQQQAFGRILEVLAVDDGPGHRRDLDLGGITIRTGYAVLSPEDPAVARDALPKIVAATRTWGDPAMQARFLAMVAPFQATAGDFAGALATARSIPDLKPSAFAGPSEGLHAADKSVTFAFIAGVQAKAGDHSAAVAALGEAEALARALKAPDQKLIAQIVIAQKNTACGRRAAASAIINEALPLALTQPEPRRSRVLNMVAQAQLQACDPAGAARTIEAIREQPGLDRAEALCVLASWHEDAGDATTSQAHLRRAAACLEAKAPATPLPGKVTDIHNFGRDTFIELDLELSPDLFELQRDGTLQAVRAGLGDVVAAVRATKALPFERRDSALSEIAAGLAGRGDLTAAMELATSIESPEARLNAFAVLAAAIPEHQVKK
jgi:tetratricopeptide (TPR) repeat protein